MQKVVWNVENPNNNLPIEIKASDQTSLKIFSNRFEIASSGIAEEDNYVDDNPDLGVSYTSEITFINEITVFKESISAIVFHCQSLDGFETQQSNLEIEARGTNVSYLANSLEEGKFLKTLLTAWKENEPSFLDILEDYCSESGITIENS